MATLIRVYGGDGRLTGRCDAKCYNAKGDEWLCVCGGVNHGKGLKAALQNTTERFGGVAEFVFVTDPDDDGDVAVVSVATQMAMEL